MQTMQNLMWTTEELATNSFMSKWRRQPTLMKTAPISLNTIKNSLNPILLIAIKPNTRIIPYPPNFNKTPARIIDPATGAST